MEAALPLYRFIGSSTPLRARLPLSRFHGLSAHLSANAEVWKAVYDLSEPHTANFPGEWNDNLTDFQRAIVLRTIRPDKVIPALTSFIANYLGQKFTEPPAFNLEPCYADSNPRIALIFVLSPGSDPTSDLLRFASEKKVQLAAISLGQGQGPIALAALDKAIKEGSWVVLQNCHLAESWMPSLERFVEERMTLGTPHDQFRMWLTSYPSDHFPVVLLQNGVKMTNEPPRGLRANLVRSYTSDPINDSTFFNGCSVRPREWRSLLFGLCFFHAFVQERRAFGPLGWNVPYEFNESDLRISVKQLQMFLNEYPEEIPFAAIRYLTGECNYGGRVTDDKDRRTLNTILSEIYCQSFIDDNGEGGRPISESGAYTTPPYSETQLAYLSYIKTTIPADAPPEVYGLHSNAAITKEIGETNKLMANLSLLQAESGGGGGSGGASGSASGGGASGGGGGGNSKDDVIFAVASDVLNRLPSDFDVERTQAAYPVRYEESMNTVLCQVWSAAAWEQEKRISPGPTRVRVHATRETVTRKRTRKTDPRPRLATGCLIVNRS